MADPLVEHVVESFLELREEILADTGCQLIWLQEKKQSRLLIGIPEIDENGDERLIIVSWKPWVASLGRN